MNLARTSLAALATMVAVGCTSSIRSSTHGLDGRPEREAVGSEAKRNMEDFLGMTSAFIRRVGQDVRAKGYTVIFTDIGPESLERDAPDVFRDLAKRSSGGGVQVRGFSQAEEKGGLFLDKRTGAKGVGLWMANLDEDGQGGYVVTGSWSWDPGQDDSHNVRYLVVRDRNKWKAQDYRPAPQPTSGARPLFPGVSFFDGPEPLSGQLVFQRLDYARPNHEWKCLSNLVYSLDLETKTLAQLADLGTLDAHLVKVSDDGRILCLYDMDGGLNTRFFVHSVEQGQTKQVKVPRDIETLGIAVLGETVFVASSSYGPLHQYDFPSGSLSEFHPAAVPVGKFAYPRTHFNEPGVLYVQYDSGGYFRWIQSSGELTEVPDFSYCMTADGEHVWLADRKGNSYPLVISSTSHMRHEVSAGVGDKVTQPRVITNFKFPGGRSCGLEQLSPCGGYGLLRVEAGGAGVFSGCETYYIVDLADGHNRMLLRNDYAELHHDLGTVSEVFWVKKVR